MMSTEEAVEPESPPTLSEEIQPQVDFAFKLDADRSKIVDMISAAAESAFSRLDASRDDTLRGLMAELDVQEMRGADLSGVDLRGEDLSGIDFESAIFVNADLRNCNLRDANLRNANMAGANLEGANLEGAKMDGILQLVNYPKLR